MLDADQQSCSLQLHGYTERRDVKATYSSPSAVGVSSPITSLVLNR